MNIPHNHLNADQLDDLLIGDAAPEVTAHLAACTDCAARLTAAQASLQLPIASFNAASLAWGQRRSATLPLQIHPARTGFAASGRVRLALGATAAVLGIALTLPLLHHDPATPVPNQTAQKSVATPASLPPTQTASTTPTVAAQPPLTQQQQIASDNQLLNAINHELASSETPADLLRAAGAQDSSQSSPDATHNE